MNTKKLTGVIFDFAGIQTEFKEHEWSIEVQLEI